MFCATRSLARSLDVAKKRADEDDLGFSVWVNCTEESQSIVGCSRYPRRRSRSR